MTQQEIKDTIKDLKDGLASSFTPEQFKPRMEAKIKELEAQLTTEKKPERTKFTIPAEPKKETPAVKKPEAKTSENSVILTDGKQKIEVKWIKVYPKNIYEISKSVAKKLLKSNKFNDDKWGQLYVADQYDEEDPNWIFIEDTKEDELEQFSDLDEGRIFLTLGDSIKEVTGKPERTKFTIPAEPKKETPERKKSVPQPKAKEEKYPEDEDDYCAKVIAQAKERRRKAKERAKLPQKTEATKNKEKLEKVFDNVKERAEDNNITKAELVKLISETKSLLTMLEKKLASL
jgi:hypothetical protein